MNQEIREKDIKDFEKYAKQLSNVVERIRKYCPEVNGFMECDSLNLMYGYWDNVTEANDKCVTSVKMPHFDAGTW